MSVGGRIVVSGQVAEYNRQTPLGIREVTRFITHRLRMEGLVVYDYAPKFTDAIGQMAALINVGKLNYTEDIIAGIENAPDAYAGYSAVRIWDVVSLKPEASAPPNFFDSFSSTVQKRDRKQGHGSY